MRGFGIANYRSFCSEGAWFPELSKINIFIGKNNAGKSNVLKFLRDLGNLLRNAKEPGLGEVQHKHWSEGDTPAIDLTLTLSELGLNWGHFGFHESRDNLQSPDHTELRFRFHPTERQWGRIDPFAFLRDRPNVHQHIWRQLNARNLPLTGDQIRTSLNGQHWQHHASQILQKEFRDVFYVQQFREIRDGDGASEEKQVAGYKLAEKLGLMKSPGEKRNADQAQFYKIQTWIRDLLDLPDLEIDIEH